MVKLVPDAASRAVLVETLRVCNAEAKATGIGSQLAQHVVKKVCDAYRTVYAQARSGLLRRRRAAKAPAKPVAFRAGAAQPFDDRCLSWDLEARTGSIRAAEGRLRGSGFACSRQDLKVLRAHRQGESDLFERDGELYSAADTIAFAIVSAAERTGRGIALEDLEDIRERVRLTRSQRGRISNRPFHQLAQHIACKAKRAGVPVVVVDARHTSQMCPLCHHAERANRRSRDRFECRGCGLAGPADAIAAVNVRAHGRMAWAVSQGSRVAA